MEKFKYTIVVILCTLGVLFIIVMFLPDDEEEAEQTSAQAVETVQEADAEDAEEPGAEEDEEETDVSEAQEAEPAQLIQSIFADQEEEEEAAAETAQQDDAEPASQPAAEAAAETETVKPEEQTASANIAAVHIPSSDVSDQALKFKTVTLDNQKATQDIFSGYDLTIVHIWGTYCDDCIAEMSDYAALDAELPDNVNLVGLITDVYDGIDSNVSDANRILKNAGAGFMNLRISDDLYAVTSYIQYLPSTFFVDREGHVVGGMMDGATIKETKKRLGSYIG